MGDKALVCVLCGEPWEPSFKNRCECGGFCTWGEAKGANPMSWQDYDKLIPQPVPSASRFSVRDEPTEPAKDVGASKARSSGAEA